MSNPNESNDFRNIWFYSFSFFLYIYRNRNLDPVYCSIGSGCGNVKFGRNFDLYELLVGAEIIILIMIF